MDQAVEQQDDAGAGARDVDGLAVQQPSMPSLTAAAAPSCL